MNKHNLVTYNHGYKNGHTCPTIHPNIVEDTILLLNNKPIGFYLKKAPKVILQYMKIANYEFRSKRVPKVLMQRGTEKLNATRGVKSVLQYSSIIGAVPAKHHMRRPYNSVSALHKVETAKTFIKAMLLTAKESEKIIEKLLPEIYHEQKKILLENVDKKYRFSSLFTSSISNYNVAADFHQDRKNLPGTVNVIFTKRSNTTGGCLHVPDYNITFAQEDGSMIAYPAWANLHAVTPIKSYKNDSYRNSFIFYPLKGFK